MLCYAMLCYAICHACYYATLCYAIMRCYAMLCYYALHCCKVSTFTCQKTNKVLVSPTTRLSPSLPSLNSALIMTLTRPSLTLPQPVLTNKFDSTLTNSIQNHSIVLFYVSDYWSIDHSCSRASLCRGLGAVWQHKFWRILFRIFRFIVSHHVTGW